VLRVEFFSFLGFSCEAAPSFLPSSGLFHSIQLMLKLTRRFLLRSPAGPRDAYFFFGSETTRNPF